MAPMARSTRRPLRGPLRQNDAVQDTSSSEDTKWSRVRGVQRSPASGERPGSPESGERPGSVRGASGERPGSPASKESGEHPGSVRGASGERPGSPEEPSIRGAQRSPESGESSVRGVQHPASAIDPGMEKGNRHHRIAARRSRFSPKDPFLSKGSRKAMEHVEVQPEPFLRETQKFARDAQEAPRLRAEDARQELDAADRLRGRRLALADVLECMASPS